MPQLAPTAVACAAGAVTLLATRGYWLVPLAQRRRRIPVVAGDMRPLDPARPLPDPIAAALSAADAGLAAAGFTPTPVLHDGSERIAGVARLYEHADASEVATVMVLARPDDDPLVVLGFTSLLADGTRVCTSNSPLPSVFGTPPDERRLRLPEERDPARLLTLHRAHVRRAGGAVRCVRVGDPAAYQRREEARSARWMVHSGCATPDGDAVRPTWKGAFLMPWRLLFPLRQLEARRNAALARRLAAEAGLTAA